MNLRKKEQVKRILQAIQSGEIVQDGKLPTERALEKHFNMSRLHVRECLTILEAYGVIEIRERQGIFVENPEINNAFIPLEIFQTAWPAGLYEEISEMRLLIEVPAARLAAQRRSSEDAARIRDVVKMLEVASRLQSPARGIEGAQYNRIFHNLIASSAHNSVLMRIYEGLIALSQNTINLLIRGNLTRLSQDEWPEMILEEHQNLADAILDQDSEKAAALMKLHLTNTDKRTHSSFSKMLHKPLPDKPSSDTD